MRGNLDGLATTELRADALRCVDEAIERSMPGAAVEATVSCSGSSLHIDDSCYDLDRFDDIVVLGAGKAAGRMATAVESELADRIEAGAVITTEPVGTDVIEVYEGTHPLPTEPNIDGAERVLELAGQADSDTLVIGLVSGGGSALLTAPTPDVPLADLRQVTDAFVESGRPVDDLNILRKHLSRVKGGQLAAATAPATAAVLVISDVVDDDVAVIASAPFSPDPSTFDDALSVLAEADIDAPGSVVNHLERGAEGTVSETPAPGDPAFDCITEGVIADGTVAVETAAEVAAERGYEPLVLSTRVRGEAREIGAAHAAVAEEVRTAGRPVASPAAIISGGEVTVTVEGGGRGGPNQEFVLGTATELTVDDVVVAAVDTDGRDGGTDAAGALAEGHSVDTDEARAALTRNDSYSYFDSRGELVRTARTGTNVNDLRVILVA